jgi:hypothetical protein
MIRRPLMSRFAFAYLLLVPALASAQSSSAEPLKGPERAMFQDIRGGKEKITDANRGVIEKQAKYFAGQLTDPVRLRNDTLAAVIEDAIIEFGVIRSNRPKVIKQETLDFAYELGNALVKELAPALKHNRSVVRMNAARMLYVLGLIGYDKGVEPALAIEGFGRLFPVVRTNSPRSVQCDYAASALGAAVLDLATVKVNNPAEVSIPWKAKSEWFDFSLQTFAANSAGMNLDGAAVAKELATRAKLDLLEPLRQGNAANAQGFREWLTTNKPKAASLYKDEPNSTVKPAGLQ